MIKMPFFEHIKILRRHIIRAVLLIVAGSGLAFLFMEHIIQYLERPYHAFLSQHQTSKDTVYALSENLTAINVFEVMTMNIKIAFFIGMILAVPFVILEIWNFVKPALYKGERLIVGAISACSILLFYTGIVFGYFLIIPFFFKSALSWASQYAHVMLTYQSYFNTLMVMVLIFGIIFEVPVILSLLCLSGIINANTIKQNRRIAFLLSFIIGALLAPPDAISMCLIALPLYGMIEISILIMIAIEKRKSLTQNETFPKFSD